MLITALVLLAVTVTILAASIASLVRQRGVGAWMQLIGAASLVIVPLAHICEALNLFPGMGWGRPGSAGHYLDLSGAVVGLCLTSIGFLVRRARRPVQP